MQGHVSHEKPYIPIEGTIEAYNKTSNCGDFKTNYKIHLNNYIIHILKYSFLYNNSTLCSNLQ